MGPEQSDDDVQPVMPCVDIVIVTYQSEHYIGACLRSLRSSTGITLRTVIVIDNSPDDSSVKAALAADPDVSVIRTGTNEGFAKATNRGIRAAHRARSQRDFLLLLNPDTELRPDTIATCAEALQAGPMIGLVGPLLVTADGSVDHACKRGAPSLGNSLAYLARVHRLWPEATWATGYVGGPHSSRYTSGACHAVNGAFMLARWTAVEEVGLLDERYWMYGEDLDWCDRFASAGYRVEFVAEAVATHLKGASAGRVRSRRTNWWFHRAMIVYLATRHSRPWERPLLMVLAVGILTRFLAYEIRRVLGALALGRRDLLHKPVP